MIHTITYQDWLKAKAKFRKKYKCKTDRSSSCSYKVAKMLFPFINGILNVKYKSGGVLQIPF